MNPLERLFTAILEAQQRQGAALQTVQQGIATLQKGLGELVFLLTAPRKLTRDDKGLVTGFTIGDQT